MKLKRKQRKTLLLISDRKKTFPVFLPFCWLLNALLAIRSWHFLKFYSHLYVFCLYCHHLSVICAACPHGCCKGMPTQYIHDRTHHLPAHCCPWHPSTTSHLFSVKTIQGILWNFPPWVMFSIYHFLHSYWLHSLSPGWHHCIHLIFFPILLYTLVKVTFQAIHLCHICS
jgi:hypothetical protein